MPWASLKPVRHVDLFRVIGMHCFLQGFHTLPLPQHWPLLMLLLLPLCAGAAVSRHTAHHSSTSMGRLSSVGVVGWEEEFGLVPGIGGTGVLGEGWELAAQRPEQQPPDFEEVLPDIDIVYAIRSRRAERQMASHANITTQTQTLQSQTQQYIGAITKSPLVRAKSDPGLHIAKLDAGPAALPSASGTAAVPAGAAPAVAPVVDASPAKVEGGATGAVQPSSASRGRGRSGSVSMETAEALASVLAGSTRDMDMNLEVLTHSEDSGDSESDAEHFHHHTRPKKKHRGLPHLPEYYWCVHVHTLVCAVRA